MLHITNGSSVSLAETGLGGEILVWTDSLHGDEAPTVPADDEIVLWFEHDLYDQAQLIHVLDHLHDSPAHISLIQSDRFLGPMRPTELWTLWSTRRAVTEREFSVASNAWGALRSQDPAKIEAVLAQDTAALPYLAVALRRRLEEFPSAETGLGRTERQLLEILAEGPRTFSDLFVASQKREEAIFLGDTHVRDYLEGLNGCVRESDGRYSITDRGRDVLGGRARFQR
jgi:hypothetical protein